ncbi:MAG: hypothetical protein P8M68_04775 [Aquiluna sp.]|nr:hypothetical protein [Aquiluna sp.]
MLLDVAHDFPSTSLYSNIPYQGVALVTDGGPNADKTLYLGNLIIYAHLTAEVLLY